MTERRLVPYEMVKPGFEAVYTGEKSDVAIEPDGWPRSRFTDDDGNVIEEWSVWTWRNDPAKWDDEIRRINAMQVRLGPLSDDVRQIRAHIGSLVSCEQGIPMTVDDLLAAIGRGSFLEPPLHNGCWCCGMWWECRGTQHGQAEAMAAIEQIMLGYLDGQAADALAARFPDAEGFVRRAFSWLPPAGELSRVQRLLLERMLLPFEFLTKRNEDYATVNHNCFEEGGRGPEIDREVAELAGLPEIAMAFKPEYRDRLETITDAAKRELYTICCHIAWGVHGLSDCHHATFRFVESWIHGIGTGKFRVEGRKSGAERERLARLFFGYALALDKWLLGRSMQFLLLDLGHMDLEVDPKDETQRVYANLGPDHDPVKEWLAACLWRSLSGLTIHKELHARAAEQGVSTREWMDAQLKGGG
jgi:hypothetical protein